MGLEIRSDIYCALYDGVRGVCAAGVMFVGDVVHECRFYVDFYKYPKLLFPYALQRTSSRMSLQFSHLCLRGFVYVCSGWDGAEMAQVPLIVTIAEMHRVKMQGASMQWLSSAPANNLGMSVSCLGPHAPHLNFCATCDFLTAARLD